MNGGFQLETTACLRGTARNMNMNEALKGSLLIPLRRWSSVHSFYPRPVLDNGNNWVSGKVSFVIHLKVLTMAIADDVKRVERRNSLQCVFFVLSLTSLSILFASVVIHMQQDLTFRMNEIEQYHKSFTSRLNDSLENMNSTVAQVQENVEQTVQEVNDNVVSQNSLAAYQFAGTFCILGSLIACWHMTAHLQHMHAPTVQRKIIAIMWMIPIYSVSSFLGLVFVKSEGFLSIFKDIYEAVSFLKANFTVNLYQCFGQISLIFSSTN